MRSVSDTGATAPISALTYAFSIGWSRGQSTDDFARRIVATKRRSAARVKRVNRLPVPARLQAKIGNARI
jgi:hypothetical protein